MSKSTYAAAILAVVLGSQSGAFAADEVTPDRLLKADSDAGNWLTHHKDYSAQRFSPLKQINKDNVKNLHVAWTLQLGGIEGGGIW
jgi:alcohol dehydrogenase (cytochrome c)